MPIRQDLTTRCPDSYYKGFCLVHDHSSVFIMMTSFDYRSLTISHALSRQTAAIAVAFMFPLLSGCIITPAAPAGHCSDCDNVTMVTTCLTGGCNERSKKEEHLKSALQLGPIKSRPRFFPVPTRPVFSRANLQDSELSPAPKTPALPLK